MKPTIMSANNNIMKSKSILQLNGTTATRNDTENTNMVTSPNVTTQNMVVGNNVKYDKLNTAILGSYNKRDQQQTGNIVHINVSSELTSPKNINSLGINTQAATQFKIV